MPSARRTKRSQDSENASKDSERAPKRVRGIKAKDAGQDHPLELRQTTLEPDVKIEKEDHIGIQPVSSSYEKVWIKALAFAADTLDLFNGNLKLIQRLTEDHRSDGRCGAKSRTDGISSKRRNGYVAEECQLASEITSFVNNFETQVSRLKGELDDLKIRFGRGNKVGPKELQELEDSFERLQKEAGDDHKDNENDRSDAMDEDSCDVQTNNCNDSITDELGNELPSIKEFQCTSSAAISPKDEEDQKSGLIIAEPASSSRERMGKDCNREGSWDRMVGDALRGEAIARRLVESNVEMTDDRLRSYLEATYGLHYLSENLVQESQESKKPDRSRNTQRSVQTQLKSPPHASSGNRSTEEEYEKQDVLKMVDVFETRHRSDPPILMNKSQSRKDGPYLPSDASLAACKSEQNTKRLHPLRFKSSDVPDLSGESEDEWENSSPRFISHIPSTTAIASRSVVVLSDDEYETMSFAKHSNTQDGGLSAGRRSIRSMGNVAELPIFVPSDDDEVGAFGRHPDDSKERSVNGALERPIVVPSDDDGDIGAANAEEFVFCDKADSTDDATDDKYVGARSLSQADVVPLKKEDRIDYQQNMQSALNPRLRLRSKRGVPTSCDIANFVNLGKQLCKILGDRFADARRAALGLDIDKVLIKQRERLSVNAQLRVKDFASADEQLMKWRSIEGEVADGRDVLRRGMLRHLLQYFGIWEDLRELYLKDPKTFDHEIEMRRMRLQDGQLKPETPLNHVGRRRVHLRTHIARFVQAVLDITYENEVRYFKSMGRLAVLLCVVSLDDLVVLAVNRTHLGTSSKCYNAFLESAFGHGASAALSKTYEKVRNWLARPKDSSAV